MTQVASSNIVLSNPATPQKKETKPVETKRIIIVEDKNKQQVYQQPIQDSVVFNNPVPNINAEQQKAPAKTSQPIQKTVAQSNYQQSQQTVRNNIEYNQQAQKTNKKKKLAKLLLIGAAVVGGVALAVSLCNKNKQATSAKTLSAPDLDKYTDEAYTDTKTNLEKQKELLSRKMESLKNRSAIEKNKEKILAIDNQLESLDLNYKRYRMKNQLTLMKGQYATDYQDFAEKVAKKAKDIPDFKIENDKELSKQLKNLKEAEKAIKQAKAEYAPIKKAAKNNNYFQGLFQGARARFELDIKNRMLNNNLTTSDIAFVNSISKSGILRQRFIDGNRLLVVNSNAMPNLSDDVNQIIKDHNAFQQNKAVFKIGEDSKDILNKHIKLSKQFAKGIDDARWTQATGKTYHTYHADDVADFVEENKQSFLDTINKNPYCKPIADCTVENGKLNLQYKGEFIAPSHGYKDRGTRKASRSYIQKQ